MTAALITLLLTCNKDLLLLALKVAAALKSMDECSTPTIAGNSTVAEIPVILLKYSYRQGMCCKGKAT